MINFKTILCSIQIMMPHSQTSPCKHEIPKPKEIYNMSKKILMQDIDKWVGKWCALLMAFNYVVVFGE